MKRLLLTVISLVGLTLARAQAAVIYSGLKDIVIPTDFVGVYLDVDTGATGTNDNSPPTGWDINPFFGGTGVANSPGFQPARTGTGITDPIIALSVGDVIGNALTFSAGYGGSEGHMGTEYIAGEEAYLPFKFTTNSPGAMGPYFGWLRVIFTEATPGALIKDWAYENGAAPIITGRVIQGSPTNGAQVVTLSPGQGESFTLGSVLTDTGGNINSVLKTGTGTTILAAANTYSGSTTIEGGILSINAAENLGDGSSTNVISIGSGTLRVTGSGVNLGVNRALAIGAGGATIDVTDGSDLTLSGTITANGTILAKTGLGTLTLDSALGNGSATIDASAGTLNFGVSQSPEALNIGANAVVVLSDLAPAPGGLASSAQAVPEPGSIPALLAGALAIFGRRRPNNRRIALSGCD